MWKEQRMGEVVWRLNYAEDGSSAPEGTDQATLPRSLTTTNFTSQSIEPLNSFYNSRFETTVCALNTIYVVCMYHNCNLIIYSFNNKLPLMVSHHWNYIKSVVSAPKQPAAVIRLITIYKLMHVPKNDNLRSSDCA